MLSSGVGVQSVLCGSLSPSAAGVCSVVMATVRPVSATAEAHLIDVFIPIGHHQEASVVQDDTVDVLEAQRDH